MLKSPKINLILASTIILGIIGMFNFTNALIKTPTKSVAQPLYTPPLCTGTTECTSWGLCINELKTCNAGSYTLTPSGCSGGVVSAPTTSCPASENARTVYGYAWSDNVGYISFSGNIGAGAAPAPGPTVPDAPTIGTANAGNGQATVTFTAPASNGGSAITGYTVTSSPGNITNSSSASPITITGLTNFTTYTFTVKATNGIGVGPASAPSNSITPSLTWSPIMVNTWYYANTYCTNPANGYTRLPVASELQYAMRNNIPNDWPTYEQSSTYWRWWTSTLCTSGYFGSYPCGNPALGGVITGYSGGAWDEYPLNANLSTRFRCVK